VWRNRDGVEVIEEHVIANMGHGTPIHAAATNPGEVAGPYMLDVGISSTRRIVAFWKLDRASSQARVVPPQPNPQQKEVTSRIIPAQQPSTPQQAPGSTGRVQEVIEKALRSAGLMR
jgi:hypothetical protein